MIFVKLSLGMFFLRIIVQKQLRWIVYAAMTLSTVYNLFTSFWDIGVCGNPTNYLENLLKGNCVPKNAQIALTYIHGVVNTLTDIMFGCLPFLIMRHSSLPRNIKIYVCCLLVLTTV